jgi:hypothetical protein
VKSTAAPPSVPSSGLSRRPNFAIVALTLALTMLAFSLRAPALVALALIFGVGLILVHLAAWARAARSERAMVALLILTLLASLPTAALREPTALAHGAVSLVALGMAFVVTRDRDNYLRASAWILWGTQALVLAFLAVTGVDDFPLERLLPDSSSNGITSYLVALQVNYCVVRYLATGRPTVITPLVTVAICVVGYGRGSILAAAAIVALNAMACLQTRRPLRSIGLLTVAAVLAAWIYQRHGDDIAAFVELNTKIGSGLVDQHREQQIEEYLERINTLTLLVGVEYDGTSIEREYNNNPHNAFIRGHHTFGLVYIVVVTALPILCIASARLPRSRRVYAMALIAVLLFRAFTEPILFPTLLDTVYFALCFVLCRPSPSCPRPCASTTTTST